MKSWDDFMDALSELPPWAQYKAALQVQDMIETAIQLQKFGVPYQRPDEGQE